MHRISRRSVPAILRNAASRRRPRSSSFPQNASGESSVTTKRRLSSVLTTLIGAVTKPFDIHNGPFVGRRFDSTAAASDEFDQYQEAQVNNKKDVFLLELISNASDALDKLRFLSVLMKDASDLEIRILTDKDNGIITITDTGIGMTRREIVDNLIGQFGVGGFYSSFPVSDRIEVSTKSPKSDKQYVWEGGANSSFSSIRQETDPDKLIPRGTRLTLYLKNDYKAFAQPERIKSLVKNHLPFVSFPIYTWQEKGDWELTNETQPIWLRNSKEVTKEEYNEFYKKTFNENSEPLASSHFTTEGEVEFRSILYVPSIAPAGKDEMDPPMTKNIRLYVKRVFISDEFDRDLFPWYLSFVKAVVDSNDLPLNVTREILLNSRFLRVMRKCFVRKIFDMILGISKDRDDYAKFWDNFGTKLKLGCITEDRENRKRIAPLLRFFSTRSGKDTKSLDEYVENMKADQKRIYYIATAMNTPTPFLEKFAEKDIEVLLLVHPIDVVAVKSLKSYKEKNFVDIRSNECNYDS